MRSARVTPNTVGTPSDYNALIADASGAMSLLAHQQYGAIALPTNPTNTKTLTLTINVTAITITFVSAIGVTAGNVLIGATSAATAANLLSLLLNPTITNSTQVAIGTNTSVNVTLINYIDWSLSGTTITPSSYNTVLYTPATSFTASTTVTGGSYTANAMQLYVEPGNVFVNGTRIIFAGGSSGTITAPVSHPRIDVVSINSSGTLVVTTGAENVSPVAPTYPSNQIPICELYNVTGETQLLDNANQSVSQGYILNDVRSFLQVPFNPSALPYDLLPDADATRNLGSASFEWNNIYAKSGIFLNGSAINTQLTTALTAGESISAGSAVAMGAYQSDGGVLLDAKSSGNITTNSGGAATSAAITVGSNSNRVVMVTIYSAHASAAIPATVTFGGSSMTKVFSSGSAILSVWMISAPSTGSQTFSITGGGNTITYAFDIHSYYNAKQTTTLDNSASFFQTGSTVTTFNVTMTPTQAGCLVFGAAAIPFNNGGSFTVTGIPNNQNAAIGDSSDAMWVGDNGQVSPPSLQTLTISSGSSFGGTVWLASIQPFTAVSYNVLNANATNNNSRCTAFTGFANTSAVAGGAITVVTQGVVTLSSLTPLAQYYLANTNGSIQTSAGSNTRKIGIALDATHLLITNIW